MVCASFAARTKRGIGKRGGLRIIYFHHEAKDHIWMLLAYTKGEATDLTKEQKFALKELVNRIKAKAG